MNSEDPIFFSSRDALFQWFSKNCDKVDVRWFGFYKKNAKRPGITYQDALDASLCYGWIDGVRKRIDDLRYTIRFTPRRSGSIWSKVNIKRAKELMEQGEMRPAGLKAFKEFNQRSAGQYSYEERKTELAPEYQQLFKANEKAWDFFINQAPYYRRVVSFWVMSAKREETRHRRLAILINDSENGRKISLMGN